MDEITAEYVAAEIAPPEPLRVRPRVSIACKTDLGRVRENNEDKLEFFIPEDERLLASRGMIFLVCDGMGGHAAGQIASELTCKTFIDTYLNHPAAAPDAAARAAVSSANRFVVDVGRAVPDRRGMGTTLSGLLLIQDQALLVQVGDSRIYRLRDGELLQLTLDHTWVEEAVASGSMTREAAESHPYKHVLTRAIGSEAEPAPDLIWQQLREGDVFLLCSDGLTNHVTDEELRQTLMDLGLSEAVWRLTALALAGGGSDNCTSLVVRVDGLDKVGLEHF